MAQERNHTKRYWQYEYDVTAYHVIPLLEEWGVRVSGCSILDVGCGEGGSLCALFDGGAECAGFDMDEHRLIAARDLKKDREFPIAFGNLYEEALPFAGRQFDIVMLHDVFEHLDNKDEMMRKLIRYINPDGKLLITFPPYYSAYGAHQQLLHSAFAKIPFFHHIPFALSFILPRLKKEQPYIVDEVQKLGRLKMGMAKFETIAADGNMTIVGKQAYIIGPNHIRFGLKPIPAGKLAEIPVIGELVCTGVVYLLERKRGFSGEVRGKGSVT